MKIIRTYSRGTKHALSVLGKLVKHNRIERGLTASALAERAGITPKTLHKIEQGAAGSQIGVVFEVATLAGVPLFDLDDRGLARQSARLEERLTLLPKRVRPARRDVDDDF